MPVLKRYRVLSPHYYVVKKYFNRDVINLLREMISGGI